MFDLTTLFIGATSAVGLAALLSTDPVVIRKTTVPILVEYQGYPGPLIGKLFRERVRAIAREAHTARGDSLGIFNPNQSAIDTLAERLGIDSLADALREFLGLHSYSIDTYIAHYENGLKFGLKGETADGQLFFINVKGGYDIPALIDELTERFIEQVDPYLLSLYYFREEYAQGEFTETLPMIQHSIRVLPTRFRSWPTLLWGRVLHRQGRYDEAIAKYRELLQLDPNFPLARARWGEALIAQGDIVGGTLKMREAVAQVHWDSTEILHRRIAGPTIYTLLGDALANRGKDDEARDVYVQGLALAPDNPFLLTSLGMLYLRYEQYDPAIDILQDAVLTHPDGRIPRKLLDQALAGKLARNN